MSPTKSILFTVLLLSSIPALADDTDLKLSKQAIAFTRAIADLNLSWFEEPIRVDASAADWEALARASSQ